MSSLLYRILSYINNNSNKLNIVVIIILSVDGIINFQAYNIYFSVYVFNYLYTVCSYSCKLIFNRN